VVGGGGGGGMDTTKRDADGCASGKGRSLKWRPAPPETEAGGHRVERGKGEKNGGGRGRRRGATERGKDC